MPRVDLSRLPTAAASRQAAELAAREEARPFDLETAPLLRVMLLRRGHDLHDLVFNMHHIAGDGWSMGVLTEELEAFYRRETGLEEPAPAPLSLRYGDYAAWQRRWLESPAAGEQLAYWRRRLEGVAPLELPLDRPRPAEPSFRSGLVRHPVPARLASRLQELGGSGGGTSFMVLAAAWSALLAAVTGQDEVALGTPVANRGRVETEGIIGLFVNTLVLRLAVRREANFEELLAATRRVSLEAFAHQELPFERLVEELAPERSLSRSPLFQALFSLQNARRRDLELPGLEVELLPVEREPAKLELMLTLAEVEGRYDARLIFSSDLFDTTTARRLLDAYGRLLEAVAEDPARPLQDLPLLSRAQRHQLTREWGEGVAAGGTAGWRPVHERIAAWAEELGAEAALVCGEEVLSYEGLSQRVEHLAAALFAAGVRPGDRVGLCLERGPDLVAATLAIFRAGGVFVPLDPSYPPERLALMVEDSGAGLVLTEASCREALPAGRNGSTSSSRVSGEMLSE